MRFLRKSDARFQRAVQRLSLGVASNNRYWSHDRTTFVDRGGRCEPDSREPWFFCEAPDETCLSATLESSGDAVAATFAKLGRGADHGAAG